MAFDKLDIDTLDKAITTPTAQTLRASVECIGIGLHSGQDVTLRIHPAAAGTGILFRRQDLLASSTVDAQSSGLERVSISAHPNAVTTTTLGTVIANRHEVSVATIEHIMSAFAGVGIDHAIVEVNGPEIPIMDGSARPFVELLETVGVRPLPAPHKVLKLMAPVRISKGDSFIEAVPLGPEAPLSPQYDVTVSFDDAAIGEQRLILDNPADYRSMISGARTFCYLKDVEAMRAKGLALGGSFENAVVVDDGTILNKEGLRADNEFVAHKTLDLIGDLYLLGAPLAAKITAYKPGHEINTQFAQAVISRGAARWVRAEMHREAARVLA